MWVCNPIARDPVTLTTIHKGNCNMLPRESILSQLGKKSGVPKEDKGVWGSQGERVWNSQGGRKDKCFFSTYLSKDTVQLSSVAQSYPTLCDPMNHSTPGLPVHHHLPEFTQTNVHCVRDAIQPSHPLSSPSPPALNPSQHQSLFQ